MIWVTTLAVLLGRVGGARGRDLGRGVLEHRQAGGEVLHDGAEDRRLEDMPLRLARGHGDEVAAEEHAIDAVDGEQPRRQRRRAGRLAVGEVHRAGAEHARPG